MMVTSQNPQEIEKEFLITAFVTLMAWFVQWRHFSDMHGFTWSWQTFIKCNGGMHCAFA